MVFTSHLGDDFEVQLDDLGEVTKSFSFLGFFLNFPRLNMAKDLFQIQEENGWLARYIHSYGLWCF